MAVAIGCGAVAMELAAESNHRSNYLKHRLELTQNHVTQVELRLAEAKRKIAETALEDERRGEFIRILASPDGRLVRLVPADQAIRSAVQATRPADQVARLAGQATGAAGQVTRWSGLIAMNRASAVLEVTGLSAPAPGQFYSLRWVPHRGEAIVAGQIGPGDRGQAEMVVRILPVPAGAEGVELILGGAQASGKVIGSATLEGRARGAARN